MKIQLTLAFVMLILQSYCNLICDGDFEKYGVPVPSPGYMSHRFVDSNFSCWYNEIGGPIEVVSFESPMTTVMGQPSHNYPFSLCQNILLIYQLNFSTFSSLPIRPANITTKINGDTVFMFSTENKLSFSQQSLNFRAISQMNQICFVM